MKKIILFSIFFILFIGCKGTSDFPVNYSIEMMGLENHGYGLIDRKIIEIQLDTSQKGYAIFIIHVIDEMQIGKKRIEIPWRIYFRMNEQGIFKIKR